MIGEIPVICDGCGKNRSKDVNHWLTIAKRKTQKGSPVFSAHPFTRIIRGEEHACGQECAAKLFQDWMSKLKGETDGRTTGAGTGTTRPAGEVQ